MTPDSPCAICRGACCESLLFPHYGTESPQDEFLWARGRLVGDGKFVELESRCKYLGACGTCGIHAVRPKVCRDYAVGSHLCLTTIAARRPGEWGDRIRAAIDSAK